MQVPTPSTARGMHGGDRRLSKRLAALLRYRIAATHAGLHEYGRGFFHLEQVARVLSVNTGQIRYVVQHSKHRHGSGQHRYELTEFMGDEFVRALTKSQYLVPLAPNATAHPTTEVTIISDEDDEDYDSYHVPPPRQAMATSSPTAATAAITTATSGVTFDGYETFQQQDRLQGGNLNEFLMCPITHQVMIDPVVAKDGNTYEREAIQSWFKKSPTSPVTSEYMDSQELLPNHAMRSIIKEFCDN